MRTASTRLIWPAPMPIVARSFARTIAFDETCLHTRHAKTRSPHCSSLTSPATTSQPSPIVDLGVGILHEHPAEHALVVPRAGLFEAALAVEEDPRVLLPLQRGERVVGVAGREEDLDELLRELLPERRLDLAVEDDDAAVRADRVGRERLVVRLLETSRRAPRRTGSRA